MASHPRTVTLAEIAGDIRQAANAEGFEVVFPEKDQALTREARRVNIKAEDVKNGLVQLVLTLVKLLHELLEKQALRRIESGHMTEADCEKMGLALMRQSEQIDQLRQMFGLSEEDLNLDLGPLGKLL